MGKINRYWDTLIEKIIYRFATSGMDRTEQPDSNALVKLFLARVRQMDSPRVLELGTKRSINERSTMHKMWVPNAGEYLGTDIEAGEDVNIVADIHQLTNVTGEEQFDIIISCSSFEHFKYPHKAAHEVMKALRIGGLLFIQTHQSIPVHNYPADYFRFTREGLAGLFGTQMGFTVLATDYEYPVRIFSLRDRQSQLFPAYLNVRLTGEKTGETPSEYIYVLDTI